MVDFGSDLKTFSRLNPSCSSIIFILVMAASIVVSKANFDFTGAVGMVLIDRFKSWTSLDFPLI